MDGHTMTEKDKERAAARFFCDEVARYHKEGWATGWAQTGISFEAPVLTDVAAYIGKLEEDLQRNIDGYEQYEEDYSNLLKCAERYGRLKRAMFTVLAELEADDG